MEPWQVLNNRIGEQLSALIEQMHGTELPFILIMPPMDDDYQAQLVTNVANIPFIQATLRYLDESLAKVEELDRASNDVQ